MKKTNKLDKETKLKTKELFEKYYIEGNIDQCRKLASEYFQLKQEFKKIIKKYKATFYTDLSKEEKIEKANNILEKVKELMLKEVENTNAVDSIKKILKKILLLHISFKSSHFFESLVANEYFIDGDDEEYRYDFLDIVEKIIESYDKVHWHDTNILQKLTESVLIDIFEELEKSDPKIRFYADEYCKLLYDEPSIRKDLIFNEDEEDLLLSCGLLGDDWFELINPYEYDFFTYLYKEYIYSEVINQKFEKIVKKRLLKAGLLDAKVEYFDPSCIVERDND